MKSNAEELLGAILEREKIQFVREYTAVPARKYRWDFAFPESKLLVEIQGGIWLGRRGAHSSGVGLSRDYDKNNLAVLHGWRVLYFSPADIRSGKALETIKKFLENKKAECVRQNTG